MHTYKLSLDLGGMGRPLFHNWKRRGIVCNVLAKTGSRSPNATLKMQN